MAFPSTTLLALLFTNILAFALSLPFNHPNNMFLSCLDEKLEGSKENIIYTSTNASFASLMRTENLRPTSISPQTPLLILTPFHESQIQSAVYCSKKVGLPIRVRSGGHDFEGLSYTSKSPFIVVDMRNLHSVSIDTEEKTAWVETGATLGQLYYAIGKTSRTLAFPAGTCPTVGVGGHFSGGGHGMMTRQHSLAADNIIDAKIINADGQILDRRSMDEDLFWAIRGGGGTSFGIVVAFKVKLVDVPEKVTVFRVLRTSEDNVTQLVHKWQYIADKVDNRAFIRLFLSSGRPQNSGIKTIMVYFTTLFLGQAQDLLVLMEKNFPELGLVKDDCMEMSWIESVLFFAKLQGKPITALQNTTYGPGIYFKGKSDYVTEPIPMEGLEGLWKILHEGYESLSDLQFTPYGGVMSTISESKTPFPHRSGNIFAIQYAIGWTSPEKSEAKRHMRWIRRLYSYMGHYVSKSPRAAYVNYRDLDIGKNNEGYTSYAQARVWGNKYFMNNFERLVRVKTKVDPFNFFRNEQSVPPLWNNASRLSGTHLKRFVE